MRLIDVSRDGYDAARAALKRDSLQENPRVEEIVRKIIAEVRAGGDQALLDLGRKFDSPQLQSIEVSRAELDAAEARLPEALKNTVRAPAANIDAFHRKQLRSSWLDAQPDQITGQLLRPLQRVGVYVPGGTAAYPSTVLMTAIPARVAGVQEIVVCTPAGKSGAIPDLVLFACSLASVDRVFAVGGSQAVAAMAYGTALIPAVDKIVGPGNSYVNVAKKLLWGVADIDMLAGPSEVCVVADAGANPGFAAMDMLTQAEHDVECAAYLITDCRQLAARVQQELETRLKQLPRSEILKQALEAHGAIIIAESLEQACDLANECAPEHLALMVRDPFGYLGRIRNAGAVLMGDYSPQTLGDYMAGPSHTLPTSGTARFASPLHVDTFIKKTSFIYYNAPALERISNGLISFARAEGFDAHAEAVAARS